MLQTLQRIGKAIMLPIAALPIAGILLGISGALLGISSLQNAPSIYEPLISFVNIPIVSAILTIMKSIGDVIFSNLPLLFSIGVAIGLSNKDKGTAALASVFGFLVMNGVISTLLSLGYTKLGVVTEENLGIYSSYVTTNLGIFTLNMSVFGGILSGIITSILHNKFHRIQLPQILGFFAGSRFVPIITSIVMGFVGALLAFIWPIIQDGISLLAEFVREAGFIGTFLFGLIERALIPFGLHHVFYTPFWFGSFVQADVLIDGVWTVIDGANRAYFAQLSSLNDLVGASPETMKRVISGTTRFMSGKFPFMIFGLPAAAFAMYKASLPEKRKVVGSLLLSAGITSMLTGITEPIEFTFLFVAPSLYALHALLSGISFLLMDIFNVFVGMTFSGGIIDLSLFGLLPSGAGVKTNWIYVILVGLAYSFLYYFLFLFLIKKFNLKTPGRDLSSEDKLYSKSDFQEKKGISQSKEKNISSKENEIKNNAPIILNALGGEKNIVSVDACITRLRVEVKDNSLVDKDKLKSLGAAGVVEIGNGIQAIFGAKADAYKNEIKDILGDD